MLRPLIRNRICEMNMPGFSAEFSLCPTSGRYRTGIHAIRLSTQMTSVVHAAAIMLDPTVIRVFGEAPQAPVELPWGWGRGGWGGPGHHTGSGTPAHGGRSSETGRPPRRRRDVKTLGDGPKLSQIRKILACESAGVGAQECHSCGDTKAGRTCICYYCETSSGQCTEFYDCTETYK